MTRPPARRSSLAGASPITTPAPEVDEAAQPASTSTSSTSSTSSTRRTTTPKTRAKVSFYQEPEDTDRVRGAILHTMTTEGSRNLTQFINAAVMREVERLEAKYNGGQPFPPIGPGELPQGRPMGE